MKSTILQCIRIYQRTLSPDHGLFRRNAYSRCRYYPSCSVYAAEAVELYGPVKGLYRALGRVLRCHPFHAGGYDPVAE